ncbi:MAG: ABC transporter ATP-binding protein [candidate division NC10 bacterium]|nr:ABC transporter ATP-binding protein [candidate division NC10 bacterium]
MDKAYVELAHLTKHFGDVAAVADVCLDVPEGRITTLLGPSGCGKTTLLRLIAGFFPPDAGEIRIKGVRVDHLPPQRRSTAIVFQDYALFPHLTVFENVAYGLRRRRVAAPEVTRRVREMLAFLGLEDHGGASPLHLSGGQQQRVALARALAVEPDVLLLDEPLSNLDAKLRTRVRTELKEIQQSLGKTTIFVTHDQEEALSISDRVAVMDAGRIRQVGSPVEVYAHPLDRFVADFVGIANFLPATVRAVTSEGVVLESPLGTLMTPPRSEFTEGERLTILLRPEALRLSFESGTGTLPARIRSTSFLGGTRRHHVQVGQLTLMVDESFSGTAEDAGRQIWLTIDVARLHLLPSEPA